MVIISLLDLPLELPPDSPARKYGLNSFIDGLPEYISRCMTVSLSSTVKLNYTRSNLRRRYGGRSCH